MVTETFCTPIDPWRAHAIGMYPFAACVALVLRIFTVCHDDLHSQKVFPLGSVMRQWPESHCFCFFSGVLLVSSS